MFSSKYENDTPSDYYNLFVIVIAEHGKVDCFIEKTHMTGTIEFVSPKTISISLQSDSRRLIMFGQISLRDDLKRVNDITFAYADTGDRFVKCGLTIINKMEEGEKMPLAKSFRANELDGVSTIEQKYLQGSQLIADEWNFLA